MKNEYKQDLKDFEDHMYYILRCARVCVTILSIETEGD